MEEGKVKEPSAESSTWRKVGLVALRWAMILAAMYAALMILMYFYQPRLVFIPRREMVDDPGRHGMTYQDLTLTAADGVKINAWFVPAAGESRGAVVFCHGNAGNISYRIDTIRIIRNLGLDTLIFDYRGYGRSEGSPAEKGIYLDSRACWDWLRREKKLPPERIVVWGRSLGSAVASQLAAEVDPRGLILESVHSSVPDVGADLYPWLPVRLLARIKLDNVEHVRRVRCPLLLIHSPDDELLNIKYADRVFEAANDPKEYVKIRGDHNSGFLTSGSIYTDPLRRFLDEHLPTAGPEAGGRATP